MTTDLIHAVENAYTVFAPYRIGSRLRVCHCAVCMTEDTERQLVATPLRAVPSSLLAEFTNSAHESGAEGPEADEFRHFLPRYFELVAADDPPDRMGLDICLRRLGRSGFRDVWPKAEIDCIDAFFDAFMAARVGSLAFVIWEPHGAPGRSHELKARPAETLTCLVTGGCLLPRTLDIWDRAPDPAAAVHMAEARMRLSWSNGRSYFRDAHLERDYKAEAEAIAAFLNRPEVDRRMEAAFVATRDEGVEQILGNALP